MTIYPTVKVAPSILTADFGNLAAAVRAADEGGADFLHLDVMDGTFVPNLSFGPMLIRSLRPVTTLPFDVHLMIDNPDRYLSDYVEAGANNLTVHVEACLHLHRTVQRIRELGCAAGVALNPATSIESVREILPDINRLLVMSVNPGFGGQRFIATTADKLRRLQRLRDEYNPTCDIEVDGGIGPKNIREVVGYGADVVVVGSAVYNKQGTPAENIAALRQAAA